MSKYKFSVQKNFKCLMPSNTFGKNDNYHEMNSHFLPAIIKKIYTAKKRIKIKLYYGVVEKQKES